MPKISTYHCFSWLWLVVLFGNGFMVFSQNKPSNVDILIGPEITTNKKEWVDQIIGHDDLGMYVMAKYRDEITLFYYDNELKLVHQNTTQLQFEKHGLTFNGIAQLRDEIYLFTTYIDAKEKTTVLYQQKLNRNELTFNEPVELSKISYQGYKRSAAAEFEFAVSENQEFLLFLAQLPTTRDSNNHFGILVYDEEMNLVWEKNEISIVENKYHYSLYQMGVSNSGEVDLMAKVTDNSLRYKRDEINYSFKILTFKPTVDTASIYNISMQDKYLTDIAYQRLAHGNFQVVGYYSIKGENQEGVYNVRIDGRTGKVLYQDLTEFPTDFITQHLTDKERERAKKKEAKGKDVNLYAYEIDDVIENNDGSITMVGEQYYYYQTCVTDANGHQNCTDHYYYGNIIVVRYDSTGTLEWMELIPKLQHTTNDQGYYSGYAMTKLQDESLIFIFNDDPKNNYYVDNGKLSSWSKTVNKTDVIMYQLQEEGRLDRYTLYNGLEENVMACPKISTPINAQEFMVLGQSQKFTKFVKLTFNP